MEQSSGAASPERGPSRRMAALRRMTAWLESGGAFLEPLTLRAYGGGEWGVHARQAIGAKERVLEVPLSLLLTREVAKASRVGRAIAASGLEPQSKQTWLAAFLLEQRQWPGSPWQPYLAALPARFPRVPLFFPDEKLLLLEGSLALPKILQRRAALDLEYRNLCDAVPSFARFPFADFVRARVAVITRVFSIAVHGVKTDALVPLADMLNHGAPAETEWAFDDDRGAFVMTMTEDLAAGSAIHDTYGSKCNGRFFVNYGFTLDANGDNEAILLFDPSSGWPGPPRAFQVPADATDEAVHSMTEFVRAATPDEESARRAIATACDAALARFPNSLEEDEELLLGERLTADLRNIVRMRSGEKRVLRFHRQLAAAGGFPTAPV